MNTIFKTQLKHANLKLKEHYNNNELIKQSREFARQKINNALNKDGSLNWKKLPKLLNSNPKLEKSNKYEVLTKGLALAPSFISGFNTCNFASLGCGLGCLNFSGHGQEHMLHNGKHNVLIARIIRTILYYEYREQFLKQLHKEIKTFSNYVHNQNMKNNTKLICGIRLNVLSDILWEKIDITLFNDNPNITFYDYTKNPNRNVSHIPNYSLTFSRNEMNDLYCEQAFNNNMNVAIVFDIKKGYTIPKTFRNKNVLDGDLHDARFLDNNNHYVGLRKKGNKIDNTGFVINVNTFFNPIKMAS
jgi:hypothetical protein